jgi:hypothetical protein
MVTGLFLHLSYYRFFYLMIALGVAASRLGESEQLADAKVPERVDSEVAALPAVAGSVE